MFLRPDALTAQQAGVPFVVYWIYKSLELDLGDRVPEELAVGSAELELEGRGRTRAVRTRESASAPRRATADLSQVGEQREGRGISERDEDEAVMRERRQRRDHRRLYRVVSERVRNMPRGGERTLSSTRSASGHEDAGILACERALRPEAAGGVPECLYEDMSA